MDLRGDTVFSYQKNTVKFDNIITSNVLDEQLSNYITSNNLKTLLINTQTTDDIIQGANNKFIVNNNYNSDLTVNGTLTAIDLNITGTTTILDTVTYQTEQLQIINESTATALIVDQTGNANVAQFKYNNNPILSITKNNNIGIGITNPNIANKLEIDGNLNIFGNILQNSQDIKEIYFSSNDLSNQKFINSNSIAINYISSNDLANQNFINSNSIANNYISSNNLANQKFINSNSVAINYISSNDLANQKFINSNSIANNYISSNNLANQKFINSNSVAINYFSSNDLANQKFINSNTIANNYISSNDLANQKFINSNSVAINYISSNIINNILVPYVHNWIKLGTNSYTLGNVGIGTTNFTSKLEIIGSTLGDSGTNNGNNSLVYISQTTAWTGNQPWALYVSGYTYLSGFRINGNDGPRALFKQLGQLGFAVGDTSPITFNQSSSIERLRIHSNGNIGINTTTPIEKLDILGNINIQGNILQNSINISNIYFSSNDLANQKFINSNSIANNYISSNDLANQKFINSNSIAINYISSNDLANQKFINSNSIAYNYISSNDLASQKFINSNSIAINYISSNDLANQKFINSNSVANNYISSNDLANQKFINSNSIAYNYISSNDLANQKFINSNSIAINYISSNDLANQKFINSNSIANNYISSNDLANQKFINSNSIANNYISSNDLSNQKFINSNSVAINYISSNDLSNQKFINSNTIANNYISSNDLANQKFINSNSIAYNYISSNVLTNVLIPYVNNWTTNNGDIYYNNGSNVGIGTTTPSYNLDIFSPSINDNNCILKLTNNSTFFGRTYIELLGRNENGNNDAWGMSGGRNFIRFSYKTSQGSAVIQANTIQSYDSQLGFFTNGYSTTSPALVIIKNGNVGIGTNVPSQKLEINGNINIIGNILQNSTNISNIYFSSNDITNVLKSYLSSNTLINTLNTDSINQGITNKFIVNNLYNSNLTVNGTLTAIDLNITGTTTTLDTTTYQTEQLIIINESTTTALIVNQTGLLQDVAQFNYNNNPILSITKNNNVGIGITNPNVANKLEINGNLNVIGNILQNSQDIKDIYFSSNDLSNQKFINSNSIAYNYISSNDLSNQKFINSNSIANNYISSNDLANQKFINSNSIAINYISSNDLSNQKFINSNTIAYNYISSNDLANQKFINSNSIAYNYISSNDLSNQKFINSNSIANNYISSNDLSNQKFINSNSIANNYISSNDLSNQKFINSNSVAINYFSSNDLSNQKFINSNSISNILIPYITSNKFNNIVSNYTGTLKLDNLFVYDNLNPIIFNNNTSINATSIDNISKYVEYTYNTNTNSIKFTNDTICDVFMIGGGGGGGYNHGGGGGAGAYCLTTYTFLANTTYNITVGKGGLGSTADNVVGTNGENTIIRKSSDNSIVLQVNGGGYGGSYASISANSGGCGGGGRGWDGTSTSLIQYDGGTANNTSTNGIGFAGARSYKTSPSGQLTGGGGGGCGSAGYEPILNTISGSGGDAIKTNIKGFYEYYGGGGGCVYYYNGANYTKNGIGGSLDGIIVGGYINSSGTYINAVANSGSGGSGGKNNSGIGGDGASGKVIIKFLSVTNINNIYISSNILNSQNFINSNTIANNYISSNDLANQKFINSNSIAYNYISSNDLANQKFINSNSVAINYISSNDLASQKFINSNSVAINYFSSNDLANQKFVNSNTIDYILQNLQNSQNIKDIYFSSNDIISQKFINSNSVANNYISSNDLANQKFINSNSITNILVPYITSNKFNDIMYNYNGTLKLDKLFINAYTYLDIIPTIISNNSSINATLIDNSYKYVVFNSTTGTNYITFPFDTICDILIVGGGGAGGLRHGGGGGAGGVIYLTNQTLSTGTYNITIGAGGNASTDISSGYANSRGSNGGFSRVLGNSIDYIAYGGGGGGGGANAEAINGNSTSDPITNNKLGSGGGTGGDGSNGTTLITYGDINRQGNGGNIIGFSFGNQGGKGKTYYGGKWMGAGGGGAGSAGEDNGTSSSPQDTTAGNGGNGIQINIIGTNIYYGGGGGGGSLDGTSTAGIGGSGGGGAGSRGVISATNGENGKGGGGGGNGSDGTNITAGNGGSGVVIIKFLSKTFTFANANIEDIYVSSNILNSQKFINSNTIANNYISSNDLANQKFVNSNTVINILNSSSINLTSSTNLLGIGTLITNLDYNNITINKPDLSIYTNSNSIIPIVSNYNLNNNVGIGITNPTSKLHIIGNAKFLSGVGGSTIVFNTGLSSGEKGLMIYYNDTYNASILQSEHVGTAYKNLLLNPNGNGKVGIGTTNPVEKLDILGNININGNIFQNYQNISNIYISSNDLANQNFINSNSIAINYISSNVLTNVLIPYAHNWIKSGTNSYTLGNVGIGITNPTSKLHVNGSILASGINPSFYFGGVSALGYVYGAGNYSSSANNGDTVLRSDASKQLILQSGTGDYALKINTDNSVSLNNNVGIGITNPSNKLEVNGAIKSSYNLIESTGVATLKLKSTTSTAYSTNCEIILERTNFYRGAGIRFITSDSTENQWWAGLRYQGYDYHIGYHLTSPENPANGLLSINRQGNTTINATSGSASLNVNQLGSGDLLNINKNSVSQFIIKSTGNVGIGSTTPTEKLDIVGNINIQGNILQNSTNISNIYFSSNDITNVLKSYLSSNTLINILNTDSINQGITNKFIVNNLYNSNLTVNGTLTAIDLNITGTTTTLDTTTYQTEQLIIINESTTTALIVNQTGLLQDVAQFNYNNNPILSITKNNNVGIGITNPNVANKLEINGNLNVIGNILQNSQDIKEIYFSSNDLASQKFINSNSIANNYISSNVLTNVLVSYTHNWIKSETNSYTLGNIGIGTSALNAKLSVLGTMFLGDPAYLSGSANSSLTANTYRLEFDNSFNGTLGSGIPANKIRLHNTNNGWIGGFGLENGAVAYYSGDNHRFYTGSSGSVYGTHTFCILRNGNVGIGTTNPNTKLEVNGIMNFTTGNANTPSVGIYGGTGDKLIFYTGTVSTHPYSIGIANATLWYSVPSGALHKFYVGGSEKFTIDSGGNVGIGSTIPTQKLDVNGNINIQGNILQNSININTIYISSNDLSNQKFINSNSITNILVPYITSNKFNDVMYNYNGTLKLDKLFINAYTYVDIIPTIIYNNTSINATSIDNTYKYVEYTYNTNTNSIKFTNDTICDVFMIGGGGGGGYNHGGGGGAGAYCLTTYTFLANTTYNITVGNGGLGLSTIDVTGTNGGNTIIRKASDNSIVLQVNGGGYGGNFTNVAANSGGCGGGGRGWDNASTSLIQYAGGSAINTSTNGIGFAGARSYKTGVSGQLTGGGGGGCGSAGYEPILNVKSGSGGDAIKTNIKGFYEYYGGGGGCYYYNNGTDFTKNGTGGGLDGIVVGGYINSSGTYINAVVNSGSGGNGGKSLTSGGDGASGKVIIKFLAKTFTFANANIDDIYITSNSVNNILTPYINSNSIAINYISSNDLANQKFINSNSISYNYVASNVLTNVLNGYAKSSQITNWLSSGNNIYYITGNVGIGTTNPTSELDIYASGSTGANIVSDATYISKMANLTSTIALGFTANSIVAIGSSTNQDISITPKGTGIIYLNGGVANFRLNATNGCMFIGPTISNGSQLGYASSAGAFSSSANIGDTVLRSDVSKQLILQSGASGYALKINTDNTINVGTSITSTTTISATSFSGSGASLTALSAANISAGTLAVERGGTGTTTSTGTGSVVLSASPTFTGTAIIPIISASGTGAINFSTNSANRVVINDDGTNRLRLNTGVNLSLYPSSELQIDTSGVVGGAFIVKSTGNVGIGTATPNTKLEVNGVMNFTTGNLNVPSVGTYGGTGDKIVFWTGSASVYPYSVGIGTNILWYSVPSTASHKFYVGGGEKVVINSSGNVGIGTATANAKLDIYVAGSTGANIISDATYILKIAHTNLSQGLGFGYNSISATGNEVNQDINIIPKGTGNVGIGTTTPTQKLDVNGNICTGGMMCASIFMARTDKKTEYNTPSTVGYSGLIYGGSGEYCGYIGFWNAAGTRKGYVGFTGGTASNYLAIQSENGCLGYEFNGNILMSSGNQTISNGNNSFTIYGPNSTFGGYLKVGSSSGTLHATNIASIVSTSGNLHLDASTGGTLYLNYYNSAAPINSSGVWTHNNNLNVGNSISGNQYVCTPSSLNLTTLNSITGFFISTNKWWQNTGGFCYLNVCIYFTINGGSTNVWMGRIGVQNTGGCFMFLQDYKNGVFSMVSQWDGSGGNYICISAFEEQVLITGTCYYKIYG